MNDRDLRRRDRVRKKRRRQRVLILKSLILLALLAVLVVCIVFVSRSMGSNRQQPADDGSQTTSGETVTPDTQTETGDGSDATDTPVVMGDKATTLQQAELMAAGYDYDGAIELLQSVEDYANDAEITTAISQYEATKATCVAVDPDQVPHIFYHSLVNDPSRAFNVSVLGQSQVDGMNAWMTTVDEFDKITQSLYDNGYVYVRLRDLVVETEDADGTKHFAKNTELMLPPGKKAIVLSVDDLSYYHSYEKAGYPDKLVLDENGDVKCEYTDASGNTTLGDYDVLPRLNSFLEEHPDGAYQGARGLIALTGYNGVFGYRTDVAYKTGEKLTSDQQAWLDAHPDFNWDEDVAEATRIAEAIKESGWEFASHTWGHLSVTDKSVDTLKIDNDKWVNTVENIVGDVDTIIFAHGNDIGDWHDYSSDNEKFNFYKNAGYDFFCNVDGSTTSWVQIRDNYVRQGRINLDGFMLYRASQGETTVTDGFFKASEVFDSSRPTPVIANGQS